MAALDLIDMELDAMIQKTGKGRGKGPKGGTKGKGKRTSTKGWGKNKADGAGKGSKVEKSPKKVSIDNKLDVSLEEIVEADKGKGRGKEKGEGKGKGKGKKVLSLWGGARSARPKGSSKGGKSRGEEGSNGWSSGKSSWKGSSKGKGGGSWGSGGSYKGKGKGKYDYDDGPRAAPSWSQHDDWRAAEEDDDWGTGVRSSMRSSTERSGMGGRPPLRNVMGGRPARGVSPERSWAGRLNTGGGGWSRVQQDQDDSPPPARAGGRALMGAVRQAAARAARDQEPRERPAARAPARALDRVREERAPVRERASTREEVEPRRRAPARAEPEPARRRPREEAAPPPAATKRRREAEPAQTASRPKRIKVTNVARDLDEQDIKEAFEAETGRITKCILDRSTAFITFMNHADAAKAVQTFDRGELNGKTITVVLHDP